MTLLVFLYGKKKKGEKKKRNTPSFTVVYPVSSSVRTFVPSGERSFVRYIFSYILYQEDETEDCCNRTKHGFVVVVLKKKKPVKKNQF